MTPPGMDVVQHQSTGLSKNTINISNTSSDATNTKHNCDILLNTFQIKKKRYRVLLNYDHIVWESYEQKQRTDTEIEKNPNKKETEYESEQLAQRAAYGCLSNVVHIDEIIRVTKGSTKSAVTRIQNTIINQQLAHQQQQQNVTSTTVPQSEQSLPPTEQYLCLHYAERIIKSATDCNRWRISTLTLYNSDAYIVKQWHGVLRKMLSNAARLRVQRLLVFINPYGGRKEGLETYERYCKPLFQLADIDASCIISQRANQIRDILMTHDLHQYDAVCCVGGDGTVAEVINGLIFRTMHDQGMDIRRPQYIPKPTLPVGIIPAGSTDTVAYSLHGTSDVRTATIHLILGQRRGLDVCSVQNRDGIVRFCASVLSYGYLGDVAAKSENYRWMGTKRYEYTGVKAFLANRGYEAEIRLLEENKADEELATTSTSSLNQTQCAIDAKCYANCKRCSIASSLSMQSAWQQKPNEVCDNTNNDVPNNTNITSTTIQANSMAVETPSMEHNNAAFNDFDCDNKNLMVNHITKTKPVKQLLTETALHTPQQRQFFGDNSSSLSGINAVASNENWKTIKGKFFMITGANITCACSRSPNGISRYSHLGDGYLDLILVRQTTLLNNVKFLINTMGRNGDIRNLPFVEVHRTKKFTFRTQYSADNEDDNLRGSCQPITMSTEAQDNVFSRWNCDGEVVNDLDITMSSHCQLIDVFMRGPYAFHKQTTKIDEQSIMKCC